MLDAVEMKMFFILKFYFFFSNFVTKFPASFAANKTPPPPGLYSDNPSSYRNGALRAMENYQCTYC